VVAFVLLRRRPVPVATDPPAAAPGAADEKRLKDDLERYDL
jgi:hypothetical protein